MVKIRSILGIFHRVWSRVAKKQPSVVPHRIEQDDSEPASDLPPDFIPIETQISGQDIDGTGRWVGQDARVGQEPDGHVIMCERGRGLRCGCNHFIYDVQPKQTATGAYPGLGGVCHYCRLEADDLVRRDLISPSQAEVMSLYCSDCASYCGGCGRRDLCSRHTARFQDADGTEQRLCPDCLKQARSKRMFKQTVAVVMSLFAEDDRTSQLRSRRSQ